MRRTLLRTIFDQPWQHRSSHPLLRQAGACAYNQLQHPAQLTAVSQQTLRRAQLILTRITRSFGPAAAAPQASNNPRETFIHCVRQFDRLSDFLCRVIDLAEAIRNLHPNQEWVTAANQAHSLLSRYMNTLNTHQELYQTIEFSLSRLSPEDHQHPDLFAAKTVAMQFLRDFQRHGIHLAAGERKRLVAISDEMLDVGRQFFAGTGMSGRPTWVSRQEAGRLGTGFACSLEYDHMHERAELDPYDWAAHTLLQQHPEECVRRRIWLSQRQSSSHQIALLEGLLKLRHQFARLTGKANWAEVVLEDKMAASPENVMAFLDGLSAENKPLALQELASLTSLLPSSSSHPHPSIIHPWDRDYYVHLAAAKSSRRRTSTSNNLSSYFSVGSCLEGLSRLFSTLYGISFQVETPEGPDEVWDSSVVKLGVIDEEEGRLGTIYCDLFQREGKPAGAAHYTLRCSRRTDLDHDMLDWDFFHHQPLDQPIIDHIFPDPALSEPLHTPVTTIPGKPGSYQRPIVVFSCSFEPPDPVSRQPSLLAWPDVETLFHEMGHAIHCY